MIEEEIAELNRIKEWAVILKIYYGILILSFITAGLVSLLLVLLSLWTNLLLFLYLLLVFFLGVGGGGHLLFLMIISGHCLMEFVGE
ncbi:hypothetical protein [Enterococcus gallinarum]|uniref:hypothetical protein n=1 Tax=Enterococcus gallinarum TaxID=1353 RepID=UPI00289124BF|nr:hypothetical protein [Enterococcus gallinarum]MDT2730416.1 hypothetical protein [Enterococcus gallinarum]